MQRYQIARFEKANPNMRTRMEATSLKMAEAIFDSLKKEAAPGQEITLLDTKDQSMKRRTYFETPAEKLESIDRALDRWLESELEMNKEDVRKFAAGLIECAEDPTKLTDWKLHGCDDTFTSGARLDVARRIAVERAGNENVRADSWAEVLVSVRKVLSQKARFIASSKSTSQTTNLYALSELEAWARAEEKIAGILRWSDKEDV